MDSSLFHSSLVSTKRIFYTASSFAKNNLIYLQEIGFLKANKAHTSSRDNFPSYLFFTVSSGEGTLTYENETYKLKKGDCVFIDCRKGYSHQTSKNLWELSWVHFYGPTMHQIYKKYLERGGLCTFHPDSIKEYQNLLNVIYDIADSDDYVRDMLIYEKLISLLTLLMKESWNPDSGKKNSLPQKKQNLQEIKEYLEANFKSKISLDELEKKFYINKFYLTRIFKEQFGMSINNYILQVRITHAKQLLRFSSLSIEEISVECGMDDANYFSRTFKKIEGISPRGYREMWWGKK